MACKAVLALLGERSSALLREFGSLVEVGPSGGGLAGGALAVRSGAVVGVEERGVSVLSGAAFAS